MIKIRAAVMESCGSFFVAEYLLNPENQKPAMPATPTSDIANSDTGSHIDNIPASCVDFPHLVHRIVV